VYLYDPTLRRDFQTLALRARGASGRLEWFVDGTSIGESVRDEAVKWPLERGEHAIKVTDEAGKTVETKIVVR
jgi:membrane carboxypeptidase/penicillin-binding protein PbpC